MLSLPLLHKINFYKVLLHEVKFSSRLLCIEVNEGVLKENLQKNVRDSTKSNFASSLEKHTRLLLNQQPAEDNCTFSAMLRGSKFIDLGNFEEKIVSGKIFHVVQDDLYIDFGWKFHCVCTRPIRNSDEYVRGARVRLKIKDLELSTKFLGSSKDLTILEADCQLLGLISSPKRQEGKKITKESNV